MTLLLVLLVWLGLSCLTWALFAAVVRGEDEWRAYDEALPRVDLGLPVPRADSDDVVRPAVRT